MKNISSATSNNGISATTGVALGAVVLTGLATGLAILTSPARTGENGGAALAFLAVAIPPAAAFLSRAFGRSASPRMDVGMPVLSRVTTLSR